MHSTTDLCILNAFYAFSMPSMHSLCIPCITRAFYALSTHILCIIYACPMRSRRRLCILYAFSANSLHGPGRECTASRAHCVLDCDKACRRPFRVFPGRNCTVFRAGCVSRQRIEPSEVDRAANNEARALTLPSWVSAVLQGGAPGSSM